MFLTKPEIAAEIDALAAELAVLSIGETVSYARLSEVAGKDVTRSRYTLMRARRQVEQQLGCLFESVTGEGVRRLAPGESIKAGSAILGHIRRTARRGAARLGLINANALERDEQTKLIAYRSQLGAIAYAAESSQTKAVEVAKPDRVLPVGKVLEMFRGDRAP